MNKSEWKRNARINGIYGDSLWQANVFFLKRIFFIKYFIKKKHVCLPQRISPNLIYPRVWAFFGFLQPICWELKIVFFFNFTAPFLRDRKWVINSIQPKLSPDRMLHFYPKSAEKSVTLQINISSKNRDLLATTHLPKSHMLSRFHFLRNYSTYFPGIKIHLFLGIDDLEIRRCGIQPPPLDKGYEESFLHPNVKG